MGLTRTRFSQANTAIARIQDPITVLNNESTVANVDVGFLINRDQGTKSNVAWYWSEGNNEFRSGFSSNTGILDANITVSSYANLRVGTLYGNVGGASDTANVYVTGSLIPTANVSYDLGNDNLRFRDLWLSGTTLHIGNQHLTVTNNQWQFTTPTSTVILGVDSTVGNLTVTGNLNLQGPSTTFDSNNLSLQDSIIELHTQANLAPLTGDDGRDIGIKFHYYKTQDEHAFLGLANDSGYLEWYDSGREGVGNVFTGNTYGTIKSGGAYFVNTTPSTSTTTGALRVTGGVGIAGNLYIANVGDVSANIGTVKNNLATLDANVASYQIYANANAASQQTSITTLTSNAAAQQVSIDNIDANIGSYQLYSNANIGSITTQLGSITSGANANTAAYLLTATGNISAGNLIASGNIYGGLVPTAIFKDIYLGTSAVSLARGSGSLTVDNFNTTGFAAQANLAELSTNSTKTTVSSNISSGIAYVTFVSSTTGNVDQNVNTALTYNPNSGNLRAYGLLTDTGIYWAGNGAIYGSNDETLRANVGAYQTWANSSIIDLYTNANANTAAYLSTYTGNVQAGNLLITGNIRADSNVFANIFYVTDSIRWAGNGAVFASGGGGGGGGITYTAANTAPGSPSVGDQWYYIASDILFEYINDGDTNQWVDVNGLGQTATSNITLIGDSILQGNISVQNNNLYSIGAASGYLRNIFSNTVTANTITVSGTLTGNIIGNINGNLTGNVYGNIINSTGTINVTGNLLPSANITYSLGSSSQRWKDLWVSGSTIYIGTETMSVDANGKWSFTSNGGTVQLSSNATSLAGNVTTNGWIIPTANVTQNIGTSTNWWGTFYGIATQAQYADLAENYVSDQYYEPGTVLIFGGDNEVTISSVSHDSRVAGVVSTNPAYLMNAASGNISVALTGRVPCRVLGPVNKGTLLVTSSIPGIAEALNKALYQPGCIIGKSLETVQENIIQFVEVAIGRF